MISESNVVTASSSVGNSSIIAPDWNGLDRVVSSPSISTSTSRSTRS